MKTLSIRSFLSLSPLLTFPLIGTACAQDAAAPAAPTGVLKGEAALGDFSTDAPGVRRHLTPADLKAPYATRSAVNFPRVVPRPEGAWPKAPQGFEVQEWVTGLRNPRVVTTAPNGDIFVAESQANRIRVVRPGEGANAKPSSDNIFAEGLQQPFGIAFYPPGPNPQFVYVANTGSVVRFPYKNGDLKASGAQQMIVDSISGGGRLAGGGHWTRDIAFSNDGKKMWVSVGSRSNVDENPNEHEVEQRRARIFEFNPDGSGEKVYASGIRNPVGLAVNPTTGELWTSVNERDGLGDHLVPDYITRVKEGGFYGWPWYYIGDNQDPRHEGERPELKGKILVPDVLLQSHSASLDMTFYTGTQFPAPFRGDAFASEHGSWNRERRTGYKVIRVPQKAGVPTGEYEDFLTGFVTAEGNVWGRPVGVAVAKDGALIVSDDGSNTLWRVAYTGR
ncbi:sorbosone dehydrogenase family protein [bacterium]|nr:MAG: sorbosone dehydrogenase family protein [bacterium]